MLLEIDGIFADRDNGLYTCSVAIVSRDCDCLE